MINVLIAEDDMNICINTSNAINTKDIRCAWIVTDGSRVYQRVRELNPDVLILDLDLPNKNGIEILKEIQSDSKIKTKIFIYSGYTEMISEVRNYSCVKGFFSKITPAQEIARNIEEMSKEIKQNYIKERISNMLVNLGFSYYLKGTRFIADCINYSITKNEDTIDNLYYFVSKRNGENIKTIKSDINTAVNNMWRSTDKEKTRKFLRIGECDKPCTKDVISMIKYYIK